ncbi:MAG: hypothetical protein OEQ18_03560 [Gammaproteobacteria bacterium]|nr:hypothetical protein [Gammaproteobacteria bacterium]
MKKHTRALTVISAAAVGLTLGSTTAWSEGGAEPELELATLKFFIEFNETDEDIGVQAVLGGEPYKRLVARDPNGSRILQLHPRRSLRRQGLSDFFFESAEPALSEFSMARFLRRFPEGVYEFETITLDDVEQDGDATFTHIIPAGPAIVSPTDGATGIDSGSPLSIVWQPVTTTTSLNPPQLACATDGSTACTIVAYQVIVTKDAEGERLRVYSVDMPPDATSATVPTDFMEPGVEYELEILAVEESDNQTISIVFFTTAE